MQEKSLIERARLFEESALAEIYDLYSDAIYRYAYRLLGNRDQAEECVSETFYKLLDVLKKKKGPQFSIKAYLYQIAHHWITDQFRHHEKWELELNEQHSEGYEENPSQKVMDCIEQERVRLAVRRLTQDQQQVILLKFFEGLDNEEIAQVLNKPLGAVKSLQHRALTSLKRTFLQEEGCK